MRSQYVTISFPEPLFVEIEDFIIRHPELGFSSATEFIKAVVRERLKD